MQCFKNKRIAEWPCFLKVKKNCFKNEWMSGSCHSLDSHYTATNCQIWSLILQPVLYDCLFSKCLAFTFYSSKLRKCKNSKLQWLSLLCPANKHCCIVSPETLETFDEKKITAIFQKNAIFLATPKKKFHFFCLLENLSRESSNANKKYEIMHQESVIIFIQQCRNFHELY